MRIICFLAFCALSSAAAGASTGTVWNELNTIKEAGTLRSLAQAPDGTLISVGDAGLYRTSTDGGITWVTKTSIDLDNSDQPLTKAIFDLKVSDTRLIMVGANRLLLTSDDSGATWTTETPANINAAGVRFSKISVDDARLTVVGTNGAIIESDDNGDTWTRTTAPNAEYRAIAADGESTAVAVGYQDSVGIIATRTETTVGTTTTVTWTKAATPIALDTRTLFGVAYNGSTYAAVGANGTILTSTDGTTWTDHSLKSTGTLPNLTDVIAVGNGFLTSANNGVGGFLSSTDSGATWKATTILPSGSGFKETRMLALGTTSTGIFAVGFNKEVWFSDGGFDFYVANAGLSGDSAGVDADPDGDGIKNLAEFALGLNPIVPATMEERKVLPQIVRSGTGLSMSFILPDPLPKGITATIEKATTLISTTTGTAPSPVTTVSPFTTYATLNATTGIWGLATPVTPSPITKTSTGGKSVTTVTLTTAAGPVFFRLGFSRS